MGVVVEEDEPDKPDKLLGQILANRYQIETRIGEGAMGAVYRARHVKVGRAFAVKVLHARLLEDNKVLQRFEREAELAGRLRHPNVIGVVDVGELPDGTRYMVMDFAEGPDLATLLSEAPMPPKRVAHLTRQLLEGLFHAHEAGLIHRDFKPENVIIERDTHGSEVPRIVDFGIAILREGGDSSSSPGRLTTNGLVLGTPHYMAPEQAVADPIDHRIDLFALGIIIYEMLSGKLPFDGTGAEVARANLLLDPPPIAQRVPYLEVDPLLEAFARRLMAKKRDMRPATAKVARDLLDLIERDRNAAAAALGVPLDSARPPMTTIDSQPVPPRSHSGEGTFPPPLRDAVQTPGATPRIAPPRNQREIRTDPVRATEGLARRRRWPIAALALAVLGAGGFAAYELTHDQPVAQPVAQVEPAPVPQPAPQPTPQPAPAPVPEHVAVVTPSPAPTASRTKPSKPAHVVKKPEHVAAVAPTPAPHPEVAVAKPPPKPIDARALAAQYSDVGGGLKRLAKANVDVTDLDARYSYIKITDAMSTQDKRDATAVVLTGLQREIAARSR